MFKLNSIMTSILAIFALVWAYLPLFGHIYPFMVMFDLIYPYFTEFAHILIPYILLTIDTYHSCFQFSIKLWNIDILDMGIKLGMSV